MEIYKLIYLSLMLLSLGMGLATHGKERSPQNGWNTLISFVLGLWLLYMSGFLDGILSEP